MEAIIKKVKRGWRIKFVTDDATPDISVEEYYTRRGSAIRGAKRVLDRLKNAGRVPIIVEGDTVAIC